MWIQHFTINYELHEANDIRVPPSVIKNVAYVLVLVLD